MIREQRGVVLGASLLFLILYFGFDIKSPQQQEEIEQRSKVGLALDPAILIKNARESLGSAQSSELAEIEVRLQQSSEEEKLTYLKELSGFWYRQKEFYLAGTFAEHVAEQVDDAASWGIAGTTFLSGVTSLDADRAAACQMKADMSLQNAISLEPNDVSHQINRALVFVRKAPAKNPMKGIQMLLKLSEDHPESVPVMVNLAQLAIETGQFEKARVRLEKAASLEPDDPRVVCLMTEVLTRMNDSSRDDWQKRCKLLTD